MTGCWESNPLTAEGVTDTTHSLFPRGSLVLDTGRSVSGLFLAADCVFRDEIPRCTRETSRDTKTATEEAEKKKGGGEGEEGEEGKGEEGEGGEVKGLVKPGAFVFIPNTCHCVCVCVCVLPPHELGLICDHIRNSQSR